MGSEIALAVVGKIAEKMVDPIVNTAVRQFNYIFCYKKNIQTLLGELDELEASRDGVQLRTDEAERNLEIVAPAVKLWLTNVDNIKSKAMAIREGTSNVEKGCFNGWCPNLKHRYLLSRKATKLTAGIGKLKTEGDKDATFAHSARPIGIISAEGPSISPKDDAFKGFPTRIATMNEVMNALKDGKINMIGISGMGGIGKTTLVKQVLDKVKEEILFNEVAIAWVSQKPNVVKIQGEIAGMLGLKFTEGSSDTRAERLCQRLKKGGRVLVVLDDIWEAIDLSEVGIPPGHGCKVVFTTRMEHACTEMGAQRHIKVEVLSNQEAWNLFREEAGNCVENEDLCNIAKEIAEECGGLPIAVVTLGKALSNREKYEWEDTMLQLKKSSGMNERVQTSIIKSYNFLESRRPNAQPLLLLCSLFEEDENIPIEQLVKYSMGLDLFDDVETLEETRNRVHTLVNNLKSCNLLLQVDDYKDADLYVKLHDVVRDVCMLIASNPPHAYLVKHSKELKQWPERNRHKVDHTAIALMSEAMNELPGVDYPNLRLLQLQLKHKNVNIGRDFFQGMGGLQVFNFEGFISKVILPPSLQLLTNLQTLSLEHCKLGGDLSSIGCLKGLKILSFYESVLLIKFPSAVVGELKNLKLLDLRCHDDEGCGLEIGTCVLSGLDQLEVLYMGRSLVASSIKELNSLSCLTTLQIIVADFMILLVLEDSFLDRLKRFEICIGFRGFSDWRQYGIIRNHIYIGMGYLTVVFHARLRSLLRKTQSLELGWLKEDRFMLLERGSGFSVLSNLESLVIEGMKNLIEISPYCKSLQGSFLAQPPSLAKLQEVRLSNLPALKRLWRGPAQPPSLANLRRIKIEVCYSIESLFSPNVAKCMVQLENIWLTNCERLKGVVSNQEKEDTHKGFKMIQFPKLKETTLDFLPNFKGFYPESSGNEDLEGNCGTIQSLFNQWITFPSLEKINLFNAHGIEQIVGYQMQDGPANKLRSINVFNCKELKNFFNSTTLEILEKVEISKCFSVKILFDLEGLKVGGEDSPFLFDKLEFIDLYDLKNLAHVWRMAPDCIQGFRNLTTLKVHSCNELRYLMSYSVAKMLVNLQVLALTCCREILGVIEVEDEECSSEAKLNECIVFPQLQELELYALERLTSFCSSKFSLEFPLLERVEIQRCPDMKRFCSGEVKAALLKEPVEDPNGWDWIWEGNLNNGIYKEKREVEVEATNGIYVDDVDVKVEATNRIYEYDVEVEDDSKSDTNSIYEFLSCLNDDDDEFDEHEAEGNESDDSKDHDADNNNIKKWMMKMLLWQ